MLVEVGQQWKRKTKTVTVKKVDDSSIFTYITILDDTLEDTKDNRKIFGITSFLGEFNFMEGGTDG